MNKLTFNGAKYVEVPSASFGDYGGHGAYGLANIRELQSEFSDDHADVSMGAFNWPEGELKHWRAEDYKEDGTPALLVLHGDYSSMQAYLREPIEGDDSDEAEDYKYRFDDIIGSLENYPVLSEDRMYEVEQEWEAEAWESWLRSDLLAALDDEADEGEESLRDKAERMPDDDLRSLMYRAMGQENEYFETEYNGSHIRVDRIAEAFADLVEKYDFGPQATRPSIEEDCQTSLDI